MISMDCLGDILQHLPNFVTDPHYNPNYVPILIFIFAFIGYNIYTRGYVYCAIIHLLMLLWLAYYYYDVILYCKHWALSCAWGGLGYLMFARMIFITLAIMNILIWYKRI